MNRIVVRDGQESLNFAMEDLIKYHGRFNLGGVALAFRIMQESIRRLSPNQIPDRHGFEFWSGIGPRGTGVIDAFEMVTRAHTHNRLHTDLAWAADKPGEITPDGIGRYYFEVAYGGKKLGFRLLSGLIPAEFYQLTRKIHDGSISAEESERLRLIKENLAQTIMAAEFAMLFEVILLK